MAKREEIETRTEAIAEPMIAELGFDLWDVEYVREGKEYYLRVYIDKEGGITIDDCVELSRRLSDELDKDDFIEDAYTLEVSSPGLGRRLVKDREYTKSIGREVSVKFYKSIDGVREITGLLTGFDRDSVTVDLATDKGTEQRTFKKSDIATVRLAVDF